MIKPIAFLPLSTQTEIASDAAICAAIAVGAALGCTVKVEVFAGDLPQVYAPIGDIAFDLQGLMDGAQQASAAEAKRLEAAVKSAPTPASFAYHAKLGAMILAAPAQARLYDLVILPWQKALHSVQNMAELMIFGAGRPTVMVPEGAKLAALEHLAVAWDDSRVAARALNDALPYLVKGGKVSVLTVGADGSALTADRAAALTASLKARGYDATGHRVAPQGHNIASTLQQAALAQGAGLLAMGGFGHSRLRDFVLGGATKGVMAQLDLPVMLSH